MKTLQERIEAIVEQFLAWEDWMDKYNLIIEYANQLPTLDEKYKTPAYLIHGCQSQVWLAAEYDNGKIHFFADSDAIITKGMVSILVHIFSGSTPDEILHCDMSFIDRLGWREHLSPTRSNGLNAMLKQIRLYALAFSTIENKKHG
ncbi:MAG: SufE family protein [Bacteroidales bacterium]|nr:SufE family protein [Bacteroidales bacterium]